MRTRLTLLLAAILTVSAFAMTPLGTNALASGSAPAALSLTVAPSVLPADGGVYAAVFVSVTDSHGIPTIALSLTTVVLTSAFPNVGSLANSTVTILPGQSRAVASFKTTTSAGSTQITASSSGLKSASIPLVTAIPTGYPYRVAISTVPSVVPAAPIGNPTARGTLVVELEDQAGLPAKAVADTAIGLVSSNSKLLNLTGGSVTIGAGQYSATGQFSTGPVPGQVSIVGSSLGLLTGQAQVDVAGVTSLALRLSTMPNVAATCVAPATSCNGLIVVGLSDLDGKPVRAPFLITVNLFSSNTSVISLPQTQIMIPQGSASATASFTTTPNPGSAEVTASAAGLSSDFATIVTNDATASPYTLQTAVGPAFLPADSCNCGYVGVYLLDRYGAATVDQSGGAIAVTLTSSKASIANFTNNHLASVQLDIQPGSGFAYTALTSTFVSGSTSITASAQNVYPSVTGVQTSPALPSNVVVTQLFTAVPADGGTHPGIEVRLLDASGHPYVSPGGTTVFLNSSQSGVVQVASPIQVPAGQSAVLVPITSSFVAGSSNLSATVNVSPDVHTLGYAVGWTVMNTITPAPARLAVYVQPNPLAQSPLGGTSQLFVQLQDSNGNPAKARELTSVTVVSSNLTVFSKRLIVNVSQGSDYASVPINASTFGTTTFEATSPSLTSASATLTILPSSYSSSVFASSISILSNQTSTITVTLRLDNQGLAGAKVAWNSSSGRLSTSNGTTSSSGQASVVFTPTQLGAANVTATVSSPLVGTKQATSYLYVNQAVATHPASKSILDLLLSFPYYLIIVGAAAAVVLVVVVLVRRRRRGGEGGADSDEQSLMALPRRTWRGLR